MARIGTHALLVFCLLAPCLAAEEVSLTAYYPSPRGMYKELRTTNDAYLATLGGGVGIGTNDPRGRLSITGDAVDPVAGLCPEGYDAYDEDRDGVVPEVGECKITTMVVTANGRIGLGTATPTKGLDIRKQGAAIIRLESHRNGNAARGRLLFDGGRGTLASPAASQDNDVLGLIKFRGFNPTDSDPDEADTTFGASAAIRADVDDPTAGPDVGPNDVPGRLLFLTHQPGAGPGGLVERMRIDSLGQVGIGTAMPLNTLHVKGGVGLESAAPGGSWNLAVNGSGDLEINANTAAPININNRMVITDAGNVGIGTLTPTSKLEVVSADPAVGSFGFGPATQDLWFDGGNDDSMIINNIGGAGGATSFHGGGTPNLLVIQNSGNVGIGTGAPAQRLHVNGLIRGQLECRTVTASGPGPNYVSVVGCAADEWLMSGGGHCQNDAVPGGILGYMHSNHPMLGAEAWVADCWDPRANTEAESTAYAICCKRGN